jgi:hypothetical protein
MWDALLIVISIVGFLLAMSYSRNAWGVRVFAQFYWSIVAILFLVPATIIALFRGNYSGAARIAVILIVWLIMTGFIPGLILEYGWTLRGLWDRRLSENAPSSSQLPPTNTLTTQPQTSDTCPKCGGALRRRHGRYGLFLGCSGYPGCRYTRSV